MTDFAPTPLQPVGANLFAKREDLLPYGGGAKVRRLVPWLRALPARSRVSCLSDLGSHTFLVLSRLLQSGDFPVESMLFLERRVPLVPYREQVQAEYLQDARIDVRGGSAAGLLLRAMWTRAHRLGLGGTTGGDGEPHARAFEECAGQLDSAPALHVLPAASGETAVGFLRAIDRGVPGRHRLLLVATGPPITRSRLRRRFRGRDDVRIVEPDSLPSNRPPPALPADLPVDPVHGAHALKALASLGKIDGPVVLWVTSPRVWPRAQPSRSAPPPSAPAG